MSSYSERPWLARYTEGRPPDITAEYPSVLALFRASVARDPDDRHRST